MGQEQEQEQGQKQAPYVSPAERPRVIGARTQVINSLVNEIRDQVIGSEPDDEAAKMQVVNYSFELLRQTLLDVNSIALSLAELNNAMHDMKESLHYMSANDRPVGK